MPGYTKTGSSFLSLFLVVFFAAFSRVKLSAMLTTHAPGVTGARKRKAIDYGEQLSEQAFLQAAEDGTLGDILGAREEEEEEEDAGTAAATLAPVAVPVRIVPSTSAYTLPVCLLRQRNIDTRHILPLSPCYCVCFSLFFLRLYRR